MVEIEIGAAAVLLTTGFLIMAINALVRARRTAALVLVLLAMTSFVVGIEMVAGQAR